MLESLLNYSYKTVHTLKKLLLIPALIFPLFLFAQNNPMFDKLTIDNNTKLIGRYPQYYKAKTYKEFNFCIDNPSEIKAVLKELTVGEETINIFGTNSFEISLIQNNKEGKTWLIHPNLELASYNGHTYRFDLIQSQRKEHEQFKSIHNDDRREQKTF